MDRGGDTAAPAPVPAVADTDTDAAKRVTII